MYKFAVDMITKQTSASDRTMALTILCLFGLLAFCQAGVLKFDPRIVDGEDVKKGEILYQVSLQDRSGFHFCGGSILNEKYVITVANCVKNLNTTNLMIVAGEIDLRIIREPLEVERIVIHTGFNISNPDRINDIALIQIKEDFPKTLKPVKLPEKFELKTGAKAVVSGWGKLNEKDEAHSDILKKANVYISDQNYCFFRYQYIGRNIYDVQVCAFDPKTNDENKNKRGPCYGDEGGPLTVVNEKQEPVLVGLVSWAKDCGSIIYPTVYTRVAKYLEWINTIISPTTSTTTSTTSTTTSTTSTTSTPSTTSTTTSTTSSITSTPSTTSTTTSTTNTASTPNIISTTTSITNITSTPSIISTTTGTPSTTPSTTNTTSTTLSTIPSTTSTTSSTTPSTTSTTNTTSTTLSTIPSTTSTTSTTSSTTPSTTTTTSTINTTPNITSST